MLTFDFFEIFSWASKRLDEIGHEMIDCTDVSEVLRIDIALRHLSFQYNTRVTKVSRLLANDNAHRLCPQHKRQTHLRWNRFILYIIPINDRSIVSITFDQFYRSLKHANTIIIVHSLFFIWQPKYSLEIIYMGGVRLPGQLVKPYKNGYYNTMSLL